MEDEMHPNSYEENTVASPGQLDNLSGKKKNRDRSKINRKDESKTHLDGPNQLIPKDVSEEELFKCDVCSYKGFSEYMLNRHKEVHEEVTGKFKCIWCEVELNSKGSMKNHMLMHKEVEKFQCELCPFKAITKFQLRRHESVHKEKKFKCNWCDLEVTSKRGLKDHMLLHTCPSELKMFKCDQCDFESKWKTSLYTHFRNVHTFQESKFPCPHCPYVARSRCYLRTHLKVHQAKKFKCDLCDYRSVRKASVTVHMHTHLKKKQVSDPPEIIKNTDTETPESAEFACLHEEKILSPLTVEKSECSDSPPPESPTPTSFIEEQIPTLEAKIDIQCLDKLPTGSYMLTPCNKEQTQIPQARIIIEGPDPLPPGSYVLTQFKDDEILSPLTKEEGNWLDEL